MVKKNLLDKIIHDITEQGVLEAIGDSISIQDANLMILYQNAVSIKIIGNHVGEYCYKAYEGNHKICKGCPLTSSFKDEKIHRTVRSVSLGKRIEHIEITASPIRDPSGKIVAGVEVARNVTKQKEAEKSLKDSAHELRIQAKELAEKNIALKVLLKQREDDKGELEENILYNVKHLLMPYIEKLKRNKAISEELTYLNILESNLNEIISPFAFKLSSIYLGITPKEIQIADLTKDGKQDKEISKILNISIDTVKFHKKNIRKKLGIYGKRTNLRTHLTSALK